MRHLKEFFLRLLALFQMKKIDREMDEEMRFHIEMRTRENVETGMTEQEARRDALRRFGNLTHIKELSRDIRGGGMMEILLQDSRYGARMLLRNPIFTAMSITTLALGIGANTVVFSVVNAVLLRPLPFKEPDRLVMLWEVNQQQEKEQQVSALANFIDWRAQNQVFEDMAAYFEWNSNLTGIDDPQRLNSGVVTGSFFQVLGVSPLLGRVLLPDDDQPGNDAVVLLSHGLWRRHFGADTGIIGKGVTLNGASFTVVGVMPPGFKFPDQETDIWMPAGFGAKQLQNRQGKFIKVIARLRPGVGLDQARSEMSTIAGRLQQHYPETNTGWDVKIALLSEAEVGKVRPALMLLLGAVGLVLLIACVNVANLLLARAAARQREFAIRVALGASRTRLFRQLLTESLLLAGLGGLAGLLLASWGIRLIASFNLNNVPRLEEIAIDNSVFGFILAVSLSSVLVFGLAPALLASRTGPQKNLKEEGRGSIGGSGRGLRSGLVISEIAIALVLLIGAGLLIKSFLKLQAVEPGFNPHNLLTLRIWLSSSRYGENPQQIEFFRQLSDQIERVPGVEAVGAIQDLPIRRNRMGYDFVIEGRPLPASGDEQDAAYRVVTPGYFAAMGIPILSGQGFTDRDDENSLPVVIINQSMARQFWAGEDPVGRRIRFGGDNSPWYSIVGVVGDVKHMGLEEVEGPAIYQPHAQKPPFLRWMTVVVRTNVEPANLVGAIRSQVRAVDKDQPVYDIASMEEIISQSVANPRFYMIMLGLFAFTALILASVGIYGMLAYWVSQRRQEIGIRMALGAQQSDVLKLVLSQGAKIAAFGVSLGVIAALVLSRTMSSLLYEVSPADPFTYLGLSLLFISVATLACYLPARRAVKEDPLVALRYE